MKSEMVSSNLAQQTAYECTLLSKLGGTVINTVPDEPRNQPVPLMVGQCPSLPCVIKEESNSLSAKEKDYVRRCVNVVVGVCRLYGFDDENYSRKGTYEHWFVGASRVKDCMKFVKYKLAAFYASHVTPDEPQSLPPMPVLDGFDNPGCLLSGRGYTWLRVLKRSAKWQSFLCSILAAKKGMPRPDVPALRRAEKTAFRKLTTHREILREFWLKPWADITDHPSEPEVLVNKTTFREQIDRLIDEVTEGVQPFDETEELRKPRFPSTSANYINSRSGGGAVETILGPGLIKGKGDLYPSLESSSKLIETKTIGVMGSEVIAGQISVDTTNLDWKYEQLASRIRINAEQEPPIAVPLGLPEALKVRVITKGPPILMTLLKPFQKYCWNILRKHPVFELTGRPIDADYIQRRLGKRLGPGERFLSVDYSDATNEIHSWCSEYAARRLCLKLGVSGGLTDLIIRSLTGHVLEYDGEQLDQATGQLMGSVTSFIFLCLVNATICRWSIEIDRNKKIKLRDCPLGINGDDAVFRVKQLGYDAWIRIAAMAGMSPSIGKVYFSTKFLNMNSATFLYYPEGYECDVAIFKIDGYLYTRYFTLVPFVNMGLLLGLTRSSVGDDKSVSSLGARCRELVGTAPSNLAETLIASFISKNKKLLTDKKNSFPIPWFIPERLGGYGFPTAGRFQPVKKILQTAKIIFNNPSRFEIPSIPRAVPWQTWILVKKQFPLPEITPLMLATSYESCPQLSYNDYWAKCAVALLFERGQSIEKLMVSNATERALKLGRNVLRRLSKVWLDAAKSTKFHGENAVIPFDPNHYPKHHSVDDVPLLYHQPRHVWRDFLDPDVKHFLL